MREYSAGVALADNILGSHQKVKGQVAGKIVGVSKNIEGIVFYYRY